LNWAAKTLAGKADLGTPSQSTPRKKDQRPNTCRTITWDAVEEKRA